MKLGVASHRSIAPVWDTVPIGRAAIRVMIPTEVGHGFRFEAGHCSGMKPASIPR
jgi:hypothetical protein